MNRHKKGKVMCLRTLAKSTVIFTSNAWQGNLIIAAISFYNYEKKC